MKRIKRRRPVDNRLFPQHSRKRRIKLLRRRLLSSAPTLRNHQTLNFAKQLVRLSIYIHAARYNTHQITIQASKGSAPAPRQRTKVLWTPFCFLQIIFRCER